MPARPSWKSCPLGPRYAPKRAAALAAEELRLPRSRLFPPRHQPPQRRHQTRRRAAQLLMMMQRQLPQHPLALRRQHQQHFPPVVLRPLSPHVASFFQPVDQLHRAVMLNLHPVRQLPDPRSNSLRHPLDGQHELVLSPLQPGRLHGALAEVQKLPNLVPELGQCLVVRQGKFLHPAWLVSCCDSPSISWDDRYRKPTAIARHPASLLSPPPYRILSPQIWVPHFSRAFCARSGIPEPTPRSPRDPALHPP